MPSARPRVLIRPQDGQDVPWRAAATAAGVSLSEWICQAADAALEVPRAPVRERTPEPARPQDPAPPMPASPTPAPASSPAVPNVQTAPRRHWQAGRLARVECESREFVDGKCTNCGTSGP